MPRNEAIGWPWSCDLGLIAIQKRLIQLVLELLSGEITRGQPTQLPYNQPVPCVHRWSMLWLLLFIYQSNEVLCRTYATLQHYLHVVFIFIFQSCKLWIIIQITIELSPLLFLSSSYPPPIHPFATCFTSQYCNYTFQWTWIYHFRNMFHIT